MEHLHRIALAIMYESAFPLLHNLFYFQNHQKLIWVPNTFREIKRGLKCMRVLRIPSGMIFNPHHFSDLLTRQPIIPFGLLK